MHRHSYLENELSMLEMFYHPFFSNLILNKMDDVDNFKQIRKEQLAFYLKRKKKEFKEINEQCFEKVFLILTELEKEYTLKKQKLSL